MSDPTDRRDEETPQEPVAPREPGEELDGEELEEVSGGVIDGGCIPSLPWQKPAPWEVTTLPEDL